MIIGIRLSSLGDVTICLPQWIALQKVSKNTEYYFIPIVYAEQAELLALTELEHWFVYCPVSKIFTGNAPALSIYDLPPHTVVLDFQHTQRSKRCIASIESITKLAPMVYKIPKHGVARRLKVFPLKYVSPSTPTPYIGVVQQRWLETILPPIHSQIFANIQWTNIQFQNTRPAPAREYTNQSNPYIVAISPFTSYTLKDLPITWCDAFIQSFLQSIESTANKTIQIVLLGKTTMSHKSAWDTWAQSIQTVHSNVLPVHNAINKTSLADCIDLVSKAHYVLASDSFMAHIACALQKPTTMVFGATSPEFGFAPTHLPTMHIVFRGIFCSPCSMHGKGMCINPVYKNCFGVPLQTDILPMAINFANACHTQTI
jgi:ADP-heptose:LPS heptosyltransferase